MIKILLNKFESKDNWKFPKSFVNSKMSAGLPKINILCFRGKSFSCSWSLIYWIAHPLILLRYTGCFKKSAWILLYPRIGITCKPCDGFTKCFFLQKTEIHTQILNTEPFLYNFPLNVSQITAILVIQENSCVLCITL